MRDKSELTPNVAFDLVAFALAQRDYQLIDPELPSHTDDMGDFPKLCPVPLGL